MANTRYDIGQYLRWPLGIVRKIGFSSSSYLRHCMMERPGRNVGRVYDLAITASQVVGVLVVVLVSVWITMFRGGQAHFNSLMVCAFLTSHKEPLNDRRFCLEFATVFGI